MGDKFNHLLRAIPLILPATEMIIFYHKKILRPIIGLLSVANIPMGSLDGANINDLLTACVSNARLSKNHYPENDQNNANKHVRFHKNGSPSLNRFTSPIPYYSLRP